MTVDSTSEIVASRILDLRRELPGKVFFIVDSDHHKEHVFRELMQLRSITRTGDYVIVEDGNLNGHPVLPDWGEGPYEALEQYLKEFPDDYTSDSETERLFGMTFAPKGFLVRR